jgi:hypothetical protein
VIGIIGAIVDCLECVISGALTTLLHLAGPLLTRGAQRSLAFSRALWTAYVIVFVAGKLSCGFGPVAPKSQLCLELNRSDVRGLFVQTPRARPWITKRLDDGTMFEPRTSQITRAAYYSTHDLHTTLKMVTSTVALYMSGCFDVFLLIVLIQHDQPMRLLWPTALVT